MRYLRTFSNLLPRACSWFGMDQVTFLKNERGASILLVVVVLSIILLLLSSFAVLRSQRFSTTLNERRRISLQLINASTQTHLTNNEVWEETKTRNPSFACLADSTCTLDMHSFVLYSVEGKALSGSGSPGYDIQATSCNDGLNCPLKYEFSWRPMCVTAAACLNPVVEVVGELKYEGNDSFFGIPLPKYRVVYYRQM